MIASSGTSITLRRLIALLALLLVCVAGAALDVPPYDKAHPHVTDLTGTLRADQLAALEAKMADIEKTDGTQVAVLMIPSLKDDDLFDFSQRAAQKWGIGQKGKNNGILFLIAKDDKKMRIHVGYGLEGRLTDALSDQILRHDVRPGFRNGDYYAGISAGVTAIDKAIRGEYKAEPEKNQNSAATAMLLLFLFLFIMFALSRRSGGGPGGLRGGRGPGDIFGAGLPGWGTGGWTAGTGDFGGGGSGGGGGFGGFGGGSFGGGGASGSW